MFLKQNIVKNAGMLFECFSSAYIVFNNSLKLQLKI